MVDTLAPKRVFTQRELDNKLVPIEDQIKKNKPRESFLADVSKTVPSMATDTSLIDKITKDVNAKQEKDIATAEQEQTIKSSQETLATKQTGEQVTKDVPQGLVVRPVEYAAKGFDDKEISGPIIVGEIGPEMIVPTGDGKISILPTKIVEGLMVKPLKEAKKGMYDVKYAQEGMYDVKYAQEGMDNINLGAYNPSNISSLGNPAGNPRSQSNTMNKARYYTDQSRLANKDITFSGTPDGPLDVNEENRRHMHGVLVSKNRENQHINEFELATMAKEKISEGRPGVYTGAGSVIETNFLDVIEPVIKNNPQLANNLPSNIFGDDISTSLKDSYTHGYTGGYFNLVKGENAVKDFGTYIPEVIISSGQKVIKEDPQLPLLSKQVPGKDNTTFGTPGKTLGVGIPTTDVGEPRPDLLKDSLMDINNNMVGNSIANQVREELGLGTKPLKGDALIAAEKLFQEKYTENYFTELSKFASGDNLIPEYENVPTTDDLKERIYGEDSGPIKNRVKSFLEKFIGSEKDNTKSRLIIKYNDEKIERRKKQLERSQRNSNVPPGIAAR